MISTMLSLALGSFIAYGVIEGKNTEAQTQTGAIQGDDMKLVAAALNNYIVENYGALQNGLGVSRNGISLTNAEALAPTVANLASMGYLPAGKSSQAILGGGSYVSTLALQPTGCAPASCRVSGLVYIDKPIKKIGSSEMNGIAVSSLLSRVGGDALVALNSDSTVLRAIDGSTISNPVANTPSGVVGVRVGYGSLVSASYLSVNDPRDPNFQGNLTVAGNGSFAGTLNTTGDLTSNAKILAKGNLTTNGVFSVVNAAGTTVGSIDATGKLTLSSDVVSAGGLTGKSLTITDAAGTTVGSINTSGAISGASLSVTGALSGGSLTVKDASGNTVGSIDATGQLTLKKGIDINGGLASIDNTGKITADSLEIASATPSSACTSSGQIKKNGNGSGLVMCNGSTWARISPEFGTVGGDCGAAGMSGVTSTGESLICVGLGTASAPFKFSKLTDRMGGFVVSSTFLVKNGDQVWMPGFNGGESGPACGSGGVPKIFLTPQTIDSAYSFENFSASVNANQQSWTVNIVDGNGAAKIGNAIASVGCFY